MIELSQCYIVFTAISHKHRQMHYCKGHSAEKSLVHDFLALKRKVAYKASILGII